MRPLKLTMSAFGPYGSTVEVPFYELGERGIYLITGDTGAGKTTIFDAICYALFGEMSDRARPVSEMRSDFAPPDLLTEVELEFRYADECYRIRRSPSQMRPKKRGEGITPHNAAAWLRLPSGKEIEGPASVDREIANILSMSAQQFRQIAMIAQGKFRELLISPSDDRRLIFRELFGTAPLENVQRELKNRQSALFKADAEAKTAIASTLQLAEFAGEGRCEAFNELREHAAVKGDDLLALLDAQEEEDKAEERGLDAELARLAGEAREVDQALKEEERRARLVEELEKTETQVRALEADLSRAQRTREEAEGFAPEIATLELRVHALEAALEGLEELEKARSELAALDAKSRALEDALGKARHGLERLLRADGLGGEEAIDASGFDELLGIARARVQALRARSTELEDALSQRAQAEGELKAFKERLEGVDAQRMELRTLEGRVRKAEAVRAKANEAYVEARTRAERALGASATLERRFLDEQAGVLAETLEPGEACPVCGSLEHPAPASRSAECPSEADVELARANAERAREEASLASKHAGEAAVLAKGAGDALEAFVETHGSKEALSQSADTLSEAIARTRREVEGLARQCEERRRLMASAQALERSIDEADAVKDGIDRRARELEAKTASVRAHARTLQENLPARSLEEAHAEMERARTTIRKLAHAREAAQRALDDASHALMQARAQQGSRRQALEEIPEADQTELAAKREALAKRQGEVSEARDVVHSRRGKDSGVARELSTWLETYGRLLGEHAVVDALANTANGNLSGVAKVTFETFVQQTYLDRVIAAANRRLEVIANGRYELTRRREAKNLRQQSGLELAVLDHRSGKERDVATLSGGESFEASLSLALGLSDVAQAHAGGIRLDTLFIDEGFGSLDSEALQHAIRMLTSLTPEDKLVGIISHVDALRESIDTRIVVSSGREGSSLSVEV